jgi:hypothetical protein
MSEAYRHRKKIGRGLKKAGKFGLRVGAALGTGGMSEMLREERKKKGIPMNAPVSQAEIDAAKKKEMEKEAAELEKEQIRDAEATARREEAAEQRKLVREELAALKAATAQQGPSPAQQQMMQMMQQQMMQLQAQAQAGGGGGGKTPKVLIGVIALGFLALIAVIALKGDD